MIAANMKKWTSIVILIVLLPFVSGCSRQLGLNNGVSVHQEYNSTWLVRYSVDNTFSFFESSELFTSLEVFIPEKLKWSNNSGIVDMYVIISDKGIILDLEVIEIISMEKSRGRLICRCSNDIPHQKCKPKQLNRIEGYPEFRLFILEQLKSFKLIQNIKPALSTHRAFCRIDFQ